MPWFLGGMLVLRLCPFSLSTTTTKSMKTKTKWRNLWVLRLFISKNDWFAGVALMLLLFLVFLQFYLISARWIASWLEFVSSHKLFICPPPVIDNLVRSLHQFILITSIFNYASQHLIKDGEVNQNSRLTKDYFILSPSSWEQIQGWCNSCIQTI